MRIHTRHTPSFGVARLELAGDEPVHAQPGAMLATSYGVTVAARAQGGVVRSLARAALGGESFSLSTFTAPEAGGWVDVVPTLPGDLHIVELDGSTGWCITKGCWLASAAGVELSTRWGGLTSLFGGEGGFLAHASGTGPVVLCCYGALDVMTLADGEYVTVDTGHVVGYADSVQSRVRPISLGVMQSMRSGEGLVLDFAGPGEVLTQTRNPRGLADWLRSYGSAAGG